MTLTPEWAGAVAIIVGVLGTIYGGVHAAILRAVERDKRSPESTLQIVSGATDVVEVLRAELGHMASRIADLQSEIDRLELLVDRLERERDQWKRRALDAGRVATDGNGMGTDAPT